MIDFALKLEEEQGQKRPLVLLVEPHQSARDRLYGRKLRDAGYEVIACATSREATAILNRLIQEGNPPSVVITEVPTDGLYIPGTRSGYDVLTAVRNANLTLPTPIPAILHSDPDLFDWSVINNLGPEITVTTVEKSTFPTPENDIVTAVRKVLNSDEVGQGSSPQPR